MWGPFQRAAQPEADYNSTMDQQSIQDKLYAFKYFVSGHGLAFVLFKATTSQLIGPKKKHLNYLVALTNEPNVSVPRLAKCLMQRASHPSWTVAFKSLITMHHLINYGNQALVQNLASSAIYHRTFEHLGSFMDNRSPLACNMSTFVRRYSRYLYVRTNTYRSLGMDLCKIQVGQPPLKIKSVALNKLRSLMPVLQCQFEALMAFDANPKDLSNGIINSAFAALYKDFVKLYIVYQSVIVRLLELYLAINNLSLNLHLNAARELLEMYKKFLVHMDKVSDLMRVVDLVGLDKSNLPNMSRSPDLSLKSLEAHLQNLEASSRRTNSKNSRSLNVLSPVLAPKQFYSTTGSGRRRNMRHHPSGDNSFSVAADPAPIYPPPIETQAKVLPSAPPLYSYCDMLTNLDEEGTAEAAEACKPVVSMEVERDLIVMNPDSDSEELADQVANRTRLPSGWVQVEQ